MRMGSSSLGSEEQEEFSTQSCVIFECDGHKSQAGKLRLSCREGRKRGKPMTKIKEKELNTLQTSYLKKLD